MNKLTSFIFGICFLLCMTGNAQENVGVYFNPTMDLANKDNYFFNYSIGIRSDIIIYKILSMKSGLGYEHDYTDFSNMINNIDVVPHALIIETNNIKIDAHIKLDFLKKNKILSLYVFGGPTVNACFHEWSDWGYFGIKKRNEFRIANVLIVGGLGLGVTLKKKIVISFEPTYATPIWGNKNILSALSYRLGLNSGLSYRFNRNKE